MTIEEYLNSIGFTEETNAFIQFYLSAKLINALDANPKFALFSFLMKTALNGYGRSGVFIIDRAELLEFCYSIGIETLDGLNKFCDVANGETVVNIIDPVIRLKRKIRLNYSKMLELIKDQCNLEPNCFFVTPGDIDYWALSYDDLNMILEKSPIDKYQYLTDRHDCEDFAWELKAWISSKYVGDTAFGLVETNNYIGGKVGFAHAFCVAILEDERVVLIEPQTDQIFNPKELLFKTNDEEKIRLVQF